MITPAQRKEIKQKDRMKGLSLVKGHSLAIDGGANIGQWSKLLAKYFSKVIAFEPTPETFGLLTENVKDFARIECRNEALMDRRGTVRIEMPNYSRRRQVLKKETVNTNLTARIVRWDAGSDIKAVSIDDLGLDNCDLIKLDLEGAEALAIEGARQTIKKFRPVLIVEIKGHSRRFGAEPEDIHKAILKMGYRQSFRSGKDRYYISN